MAGVDWRSDRLGSAARGENPTVLARLRTGWAVIGDTQHLPGYCLLLYAGTVDHLTELPRARRAEFLLDLSLLGEAVGSVCARLDPGFSRVNYEVLGNSWPHLHGHVHARYGWEPEEFRTGPVWRYPDRRQSRYDLGPAHDALTVALTRELAEVAEEAYGRSAGAKPPVGPFGLHRPTL
jgi:diadenosine tetraphosphate (Ap4A) HIT family hydrolase